MEKGGRAWQSAEGDFGTGLFEVGALKAALPDLTGTCAQQRVEKRRLPDRTMEAAMLQNATVCFAEAELQQERETMLARPE